MSKLTIERELKNVLRWLRMAEKKSRAASEERFKEPGSDWWARIAQGEANGFDAAADYIERKLERIKK